MANFLTKHILLRVFPVLFFLLISNFLFPTKTFAVEEGTYNEFFKGEVIEIINEGVNEIDVGDVTHSYIFQELKIEILDGEDAGREITLTHGGQFHINETQKVEEGEKVVLNKLNYTEDDYDY